MRIVCCVLLSILLFASSCGYNEKVKEIEADVAFLEKSINTSCFQNNLSLKKIRFNLDYVDNDKNIIITVSVLERKENQSALLLQCLGSNDAGFYSFMEDKNLLLKINSVDINAEIPFTQELLEETVKFMKCNLETTKEECLATSNLPDEMVDNLSSVLD